MPKRSEEEQKRLNREYARELYNLKRRVKTKQKRGYTVPESIIPNRPKVVNPESISILKKRTGEYIAKKSVYISPEGTKVKGLQRLKQERSERSKRAAETRKNFYARKAKEEPNTSYLGADWYEPVEPVYKSHAVLQQLRDLIDSWTPDVRWSSELTGLKNQDKKLLENALNFAIERDGLEAVAQRCEANADTIISIANAILYQSSGDSYRKNGRENAQINIQKIGAILLGRGLTVSESIKFTSYADLDEDNELPV